MNKDLYDIFIKHYPLSKTQKIVLKWLILSSLTNKKIAEKLYVCESAVKFQICLINKILGTKNRRQMYGLFIKEICK